MSRRLRKKIRAYRHTNRSPTLDLAKLNFDRFDSWFTRGFARKPNVRAALMVGTAITTGMMAVVADVVVSGSPAMAGPTCTGTGTQNFGPGSYPTGITCDDVPASTTIVTNGTTLVGGNGNGNGIELTTVDGGLTLGVNTSRNTTIGLPTFGNVTHDGIHVYSYGGNETIFINNAATINIGNGTAGSSNDGIYARIHSSHNNTLSVENTGLIGNSTNPVGYNGIDAAIITHGNFTGVGAASVQTTYVSNSMPIFAAHDGIRAYADNEQDFGAYGYSGASHTTVFNAGNITAGHQGISAYSDTETFAGASALATVTVTNSGTIVSGGGGNGIDGGATADAGQFNNVGTGVATGGTAVAVVDITNSGAITSKADGIHGDSEANASVGNFPNGTAGVALATTAITTSTGNITSTG